MFFVIWANREINISKNQVFIFVIINIMSKIFNYIKNNKLEFSFVLIIFIIGVVLRIISFHHHGEIWSDELYTWYFAKQENVFLTISKALEQDIHMPFYFVLLHFWIKLFGDSVDSMRICSLLISIPFPIIVFYLSKNIFNKPCAYFASIFVAINTFCIYYSQEIRFYGLCFLLSFFVAFYFVKMLHEFNKKNITLFVLLISLLFYTFSITPLLIFSYFIVGMIYVLKVKKAEIKKFILTFFFVFLVSFPAVVFTLLNAIAMKSAITYYPIDNYLFTWDMIYDILENFFALENQLVIKNSLIDFRNMFDYLNEPRYFFCVFVPVLIGLFGLIKAMFSKNSRFYLFFAPSLIFVLLMIFLAKNLIIALQTRYLSIVFAVFVVAFCFGLTLLKNKKASFGIFAMFIALNVVNLFWSSETIFNIFKIELQNIEYIMQEDVQIKDNDYWIMPMFPTKMAYFIKKGKMIPFDMADAFVLKDKKSLQFYFGDGYKKVTRQNVKDILKESYFSDIPYKPYEENLKREYIDKLQKGDRIIYIPTYSHLLSSAQENGMTLEGFEELNLVVFLFSKCFRDTMQILDKYLHLNEVYENSRGFSIFIYEKQ